MLYLKPCGNNVHYDYIPPNYLSYGPTRSSGAYRHYPSRIRISKHRGATAKIGKRAYAYAYRASE